MTTAVVAAMPSELKPFTRRRAARGGGAPTTGTVIGIGPAAARRSTERLLDAGPVDRVLMIGIAGGIGAGLRIGDLVVPAACLDGDSGTVHQPTWSLPGLPAAGTLHTSAGLVLDPDRLAALAADGVLALDMETAAVGAVCAERGVPWAAIRAISDRPDQGLVDADLLALTNEDGSPRVGAALKAMARRPGRIPVLARLARDAATASAASARAADEAIG